MHLAALKVDVEALGEEVVRRVRRLGISRDIQTLMREADSHGLRGFSIPPRSLSWSTDGGQPVQRFLLPPPVDHRRWANLMKLLQAGNIKGLKRSLKNTGGLRMFAKAAQDISVQTLAAAVASLCPHKEARVEVYSDSVLVTSSLPNGRLIEIGHTSANIGGAHIDFPPGRIEWERFMKHTDEILAPDIVVVLRRMLLIDDPYLEFILTLYCVVNGGVSEGKPMSAHYDLPFDTPRISEWDLADVEVGPQPVGVRGLYNTLAMCDSVGIDSFIGCRDPSEPVEVNLLALFNHYVVHRGLSPEAFHALVGGRKAIVNGKPARYTVKVRALQRWVSLLGDFA